MRRFVVLMVALAASPAPALASEWLVDCAVEGDAGDTQCVLLQIGADEKDIVDTAVALGLESDGEAWLFAKAGTESAFPVTWARIEGNDPLRGDDEGIGRNNVLNVVAALAGGKAASLRWDSPQYGMLTTTVDAAGFAAALTAAAKQLKAR